MDTQYRLATSTRARSDNIAHHQLDHATYRVRDQVALDLIMEPSEYFRRQFYATFEDDHIDVLGQY